MSKTDELVLQAYSEMVDSLISVNESLREIIEAQTELILKLQTAELKEEQ